MASSAGIIAKSFSNSRSRMKWPADLGGKCCVHLFERLSSKLAKSEPHCGRLCIVVKHNFVSSCLIACFLAGAGVARASSAESVVVGCIGDFGVAGYGDGRTAIERAVTDVLKRWKPDFIFTT